MIFIVFSSNIFEEYDIIIKICNCYPDIKWDWYKYLIDYSKNCYNKLENFPKICKTFLLSRGISENCFQNYIDNDLALIIPDFQSFKKYLDQKEGDTEQVNNILNSLHVWKKTFDTYTFYLPSYRIAFPEACYNEAKGKILFHNFHMRNCLPCNRFPKELSIVKTENQYSISGLYGLSISNFTANAAATLFISEGPIDSISADLLLNTYITNTSRTNFSFISLFGSILPKDLLLKILTNYSTIFIATDNDAGGETLASKLTTLAQQANVNEIFRAFFIENTSNNIFKDSNECLQYATAKSSQNISLILKALNKSSTK